MQFRIHDEYSLTHVRIKVQLINTTRLSRDTLFGTPDNGFSVMRALHFRDAQRHFHDIPRRVCRISRDKCRSLMKFQRHSRHSRFTAHDTHSRQALNSTMPSRLNYSTFCTNSFDANLRATHLWRYIYWMFTQLTDASAANLSLNLVKISFDRGSNIAEE